MNREELAWAAGFFEGEGHVSFRKHQGQPNAVTVGVTQASLYPLERFQRAVGGVGYIDLTNPRDARPEHKVVMRWQVYRWTEAQAVLVMLWPFLGPEPKKDRVREALQLMKASATLRGAGACVRGHLHDRHAVRYRGSKQWTCRTCDRGRRLKLRSSPTPPRG